VSTNVLKLSHIDRELFAFALPALGGLAIDPLVSLVDTAFVGRLGATSLAALGVNTSLFSLAFFGFNFLAYTTTPMISAALGRGQRQRAGELTVQALFLALLLGIFVAALLNVLTIPLLRMMGASGELLPAAATYLRIRALAAPALLILTASRGILYGHGDANTVLRIVAVLNAVNIVLDPLFIFTFGWGLAGAAWATTLAQYTGALLFVRLFLRDEVKERRFNIRWHVPTLVTLRPFIKSGSLLTLRTLALILTMTLAAAVATRVGVLAIAAHQVAAQLWTLLALTLDALADAAKTIVPRYLGQDQRDSAKQAANRALLWGIIVGVGLGVLFFVLQPFLPRLFTDEPEVIQAVLALFPFIILAQPLNGLVFVWDGIFMGLEQWSFLALAMFISAGVAAGVLLLVLPLGWGLAGVWWGLVTLMMMRALTFMVQYVRFLKS
jgi:MATE family multidrug resistance protein